MEPVRQRQGRDKVKNTKAFNLFKRLVEFKEEALRFMADFTISFDNNGSAQGIRNGKVEQKISGVLEAIKERNGIAGFEVMFHQRGNRGRMFLKPCL